MDTQAIIENTRRATRHTRRRVLAVVKSDGYGLGAVTMAQAALRGGAAGIGVTSLEDPLTGCRGKATEAAGVPVQATSDISADGS